MFGNVPSTYISVVHNQDQTTRQKTPHKKNGLEKNQLTTKQVDEEEFPPKRTLSSIRNKIEGQDERGGGNKLVKGVHTASASSTTRASIFINLDDFKQRRRGKCVCMYVSTCECV